MQIHSWKFEIYAKKPFTLFFPATVSLTSFNFVNPTWARLSWCFCAPALITHALLESAPRHAYASWLYLHRSAYLHVPFPHIQLRHGTLDAAFPLFPIESTFLLETTSISPLSSRDWLHSFTFLLNLSGAPIQTALSLAEHSASPRRWPVHPQP